MLLLMEGIIVIWFAHTQTKPWVMLKPGTDLGAVPAIAENEEVVKLKANS